LVIILLVLLLVVSTDIKIPVVVVGKKIKFVPPPPGPLWGDFSFLQKNIRRRSVRVLKLHRGIILTKKGDINPKKNSKTPPGPLGEKFLVFL
jgi:hypothetical protein